MLGSYAYCFFNSNNSTGINSCCSSSRPIECLLQFVLVRHLGFSTQRLSTAVAVETAGRIGQTALDPVDPSNSRVATALG